MFGSKLRRREQFISSYHFGEALEDRVRNEHPEISGVECASVFEGLRHWFHVCRLADRDFVAMPSIAVDAAWHEFILFTRDYAAFCTGAFGRFLHHTPAGGLSTPDPRNAMRTGYVLTWHYACAIDGVDPFAPDRLPLLFAIDERAGIDGGFRYSVPEIAAERSAARRRSDENGASMLTPSLAGAWWPGAAAMSAATASATVAGCAGGTVLVGRDLGSSSASGSAAVIGCGAGGGSGGAGGCGAGCGGG